MFIYLIQKMTLDKFNGFFNKVEDPNTTDQELEENWYIKDGNKFSDLEVWKNTKICEMKLVENLRDWTKVVKFKIPIN